MEDNLEVQEQEQVEDSKETTYSQEEVNELLKQQKSEDVDDSKEDDNNVGSKQDDLLVREQKLWEKEVSIELKEAGLDDFAEFFVVDVNDSEGLKGKIKKFQEVLSKIELNDAFIPESHRSSDKYSLAAKNKDTKSMIGSKLSKFFK